MLPLPLILRYLAYNYPLHTDTQNIWGQKVKACWSQQASKHRHRHRGLLQRPVLYSAVLLSLPVCYLVLPCL